MLTLCFLPVLASQARAVEEHDDSEDFEGQYDREGASDAPSKVQEADRQLIAAKWGKETPASIKKDAFDFPHGVAVDAKGRVYVTDTANHRILVFDGKGKLLRPLGKEGMKAGEFKNPYGVAVDSKGLIYVSDSGNHRIQVFKADGTFVKIWGEFGLDPGS